MSILVTVVTKMTNSGIALKALKRRFKSVKHNESAQTVSASTQAGRHFTFNLRDMSISVDNDWKTVVNQAMDEAYRAEEIIQAAEDEGRTWEESVNEEKELVIEVCV